MKITTLILADDHSMFRQGIISLLKEFDHIKISAEASNGEELLQLLKTSRADIVLLDLQMPVMNGGKALAQIRKLIPFQKVIILSMDFSQAMLDQYLSENMAQGFIPKNAEINILLEAIETTAEEGNCIELSRSLLNTFAKEFKNEFELTPRETEILSLCCKGLSNAQIAAASGISERTVEFHKTNIYEKTGFKNQRELIRYGIQNKLHLQ